MNNNIVSSFFLYVDEEGKPVYQVQYSSDGTFKYLVKHRGKKFKEGLPNQWVPYNLHALAQASPETPIYFCGHEAEADALIAMDLLATCGQPTLFGGDAPAEWLRWFAGRQVMYLQSLAPTTKDIAKKAYDTYCKGVQGSYLIELKGLDPGEDLIEWLDRKQWGRHDFRKFILDWVSEYIENATRALKESPQPLAEHERNGQLHADPAADGPGDRYEIGWKPFPLHCLPDPIQDYCRAMSESIKVDPAYLALPALIFAAGLIGNSRVIRLNASWPEPAVLFGCLIADSSTRKSPAMDWAARPLTHFEFDLAKVYKSAWDCFSIKDRAWTNFSEANPAQSSDEQNGPKPRKPIRKRLLISDITVETIIRELENNPRGLILKRDELRAWFSSFGRYKCSGQGGGDLSFWLEVFRASGHIYDRKSGDQTTVAIPRCAISVYGTIQPTVIAKVFTRDYFDSGFVSRILLAMPPKRAGRWDHYQPDRDVIERYGYLMERLHKLDWEYFQDADNAPRELIFTQEGDDVWGQWYNPWQESQMNSEGDIASLMAKIEGCCGRFALIFAVCDYVLGKTDTEHVNAAQVVRAIELAEWFKEEAMRVYAFVGMSDDERDTERLLQRIRERGGYITARELFLMNKSKYRDQTRAGHYLWSLVQQKKIDAVDKIPGRHCSARTTFFTTTLRDYDTTREAKTT